VTDVAVTIDPDQLTLSPRPAASDEVMALITSAAQMVWPRPSAPEEVGPVAQTWRFSGRWWHQAGVTRRERPRSGR
jgi:hypothetical protein